MKSKGLSFANGRKRKAMLISWTCKRGIDGVNAQWGICHKNDPYWLTKTLVNFDQTPRYQQQPAEHRLKSTIKQNCQADGENWLHVT